jgi:hypothetical protein
MQTSSTSTSIERRAVPSSSSKSDRSNAANDAEKKGEKGEKEKEKSLNTDKWQMSLYTSDNIINEEDTPDQYLSSVCAVLKSVALSEILRKDLEMIANVILYTISAEEKDTKMRHSSTKKSEYYGRSAESVMGVSSVRAVTGGVDGAEGGGGGRGGGDAEESGKDREREKERDREGEKECKLSPLAMLRIYLLRLLFVMYEEHVSTVIGTDVSTGLRGTKTDNNTDSNQVSL